MHNKKHCIILGIEIFFSTFVDGNFILRNHKEQLLENYIYMTEWKNTQRQVKIMFRNNCGYGNYNVNPCCQTQPVTQSCIDCGVTVTSECETCVANLCSQVNFTVTITNNSDVTARNAILMVPLDGIFALLKNTVTVNGQTVEVEDLNQIPLGDLEVGATSTVTYTCVVMEAKRYVYTRAVCTFCVCCCCERKVINVASNLNLLQICPCCACSQNIASNRS